MKANLKQTFVSLLPYGAVATGYLVGANFSHSWWGGTGILLAGIAFSIATDKLKRNGEPSARAGE